MAAHYVYRVYDRDDRLIYVGATDNLFRRLDYHKQRTWWSSQGAVIRSKVYPSKQEALAAERHAIAHEQPRWNIVGSWKSHHLWSEEQYIDYVTAYVNNRLASTPPFLTNYGKAHIANVHRLFKARFGHALPELTEAVA